MGRIVSTGIFGSFFEERLRRENRREKERNRRSSTKREKEEEVEPRRIGLTKKKQKKWQGILDLAVMQTIDSEYGKLADNWQ